MAKSASSMNISRIALIIAALLAVGAVAVQIYRSINDESGVIAPVTGTDSETAPSVDEVIAGLEKSCRKIPMMPKAGGCWGGAISKPASLPNRPPR